MTQIYASWFNSIVSNTNSILGTSIPTVSTGQTITSATFTNLIQTANAAANTQGYDLNWAPLTAVAVGQPITLLQFPPPVLKVGQTIRWSTAGTYSWIVPATVTSIMVNWAIGGGGAGGYGTEYGNGGGGGGGGAGGWKHYTAIPVNPGDTITVVIGAGGLPSSTGNGGSGGNTTVSLNGAVQILVTGGQGGTSCTNYQHNIITSPGGLGGSPNGLSGQTGPSGTSDTSSSYGGGGAPGPLQGAFGGAGGKAGVGGDPILGGSAGAAGVGSGSGGGGGGSADRSGGTIWEGGAGQPGYVEITYPSNGSTGGTPAQDNSGYTTTAIQSGAATGGYYTGGSGYGGGNASGILP